MRDETRVYRDETRVYRDETRVYYALDLPIMLFSYALDLHCVVLCPLDPQYPHITLHSLIAMDFGINIRDTATFLVAVLLQAHLALLALLAPLAPLAHLALLALLALLAPLGLLTIFLVVLLTLLFNVNLYLLNSKDIEI